MKNCILQVLNECDRLLAFAVDLSQYSGVDKTFSFPQKVDMQHWFIQPALYQFTLHYTVGFDPLGPLVFRLPQEPSKLLHFFNRISSVQLNESLCVYTNAADLALIASYKQYQLLKSAHLRIVSVLRLVFCFLSLSPNSYALLKDEMLDELRKESVRFSAHPLLKDSHCDYIVSQLWLCLSFFSKEAFNPEPHVDLYCMMASVTMDKIADLLTQYSHPTVAINVDGLVDGCFKDVQADPLIGVSRTKVMLASKQINQFMLESIAEQTQRFIVMTHSVLVCYNEAIWFCRNIMNDFIGDGEAINFAAYEQRICAFCQSTEMLSCDLQLGELHQSLDLAALYHQFFERARKLQPELYLAQNGQFCCISGR